MPAKIFFSFNHDDREIADAVMQRLPSIGLSASEVDAPLVFGTSSKRDRDNIRDRIASSDTVVLVWSKGAVQSAWVRYEIGMAQALSKRIVVILAGGTPAELPEGLSGTQGLESIHSLYDLQQDKEPYRRSFAKKGKIKMRSEFDRSRRLLELLVSLTAFIVLAYPFYEHGLKAGILASGVMATVGVACLTSGGLLGFLFGLPQKRKRGGIRSYEQLPSSAQDNLENISDWLTKILIGVGLVQLHSVPEGVQSVGAYVALTSGYKISPVLASSAIVSFVVLGFIYGFTWTRRTFQRPVAASYRDSAGDLIEADDALKDDGGSWGAGER